MGRVQTSGPNIIVGDDVIRQLGYDPISIPSLSEAQVLEFIQGINPHIKNWTVRTAIKRRELRGVRKGHKFIFSKGEAIRWLQTSDGDFVGGAES